MCVNVLTAIADELHVWLTGAKYAGACPPRIVTLDHGFNAVIIRPPANDCFNEVWVECLPRHVRVLSFGRLVDCDGHFQLAAETIPYEDRDFFRLLAGCLLQFGVHAPDNLAGECCV